MYVCADIPDPGLEGGCSSSGGPPVSALGVHLLLKLPPALAVCEKEVACMGFAFAGPGRRTHADIEVCGLRPHCCQILCSICMLWINLCKYTILSVPRTIAGHIMTFVHKDGSGAYRSMLDSRHDLSSNRPPDRFQGHFTTPSSQGAQDAGLTQRCLKVFNSPGKVPLICKSSPASNMCINISPVKLQSAVICQ